MSAADDLFNRVGFQVELDTIADAAQTNTPTIFKHYGSREGLAHAYVAQLSNQHGWETVEAESPDDARAQIFDWLKDTEALAVSGDWSCFQLERAAAFFLPFQKSRTLSLVRFLKKKQWKRLQLKCEKAGFANPKALATKLTLLVEGALACGVTYGEDGPPLELCKMAKLVIETHENRAKAA